MSRTTGPGRERDLSQHTTAPEETPEQILSSTKLVHTCKMPSCMNSVRFKEDMCSACKFKFGLMFKSPVSSKVTEKNQPSDLLEEREETHGSWVDFSRLNEDLGCAIRTHPNWKSLPSEVRSALSMALFKIARVVNSGNKVSDNWDDAIGYLRLGAGWKSKKPEKDQKTTD